MSIIDRFAAAFRVDICQKEFCAFFGKSDCRRPTNATTRTRNQNNFV